MGVRFARKAQRKRFFRDFYGTTCNLQQSCNITRHGRGHDSTTLNVSYDTYFYVHTVTGDSCHRIQTSVLCSLSLDLQHLFLGVFAFDLDDTYV